MNLWPIEEELEEHEKEVEAEKQEEKTVETDSIGDGR